jgi:hypothetical protein
MSLTLLQLMTRRYRQGGWAAVQSGLAGRIGQWHQEQQPQLWAKAGGLSRWAARCWPLQQPPVLIISLPRSGSSWVGSTVGSAAHAAFLREPLTRAYTASGGRGTAVDFALGNPRLPAARRLRLRLRACPPLTSSRM